MDIDYIIAHCCLGPLMFMIALVYFYFPPKKINSFYGYRTSMSMKNRDTWKVANKQSITLFFWVALLTSVTQIIGIIFKFDFDTTFLTATVVLVVSSILGMLIVEKNLKLIFDQYGNRK